MELCRSKIKDVERLKRYELVMGKIVLLAIFKDRY